VALQAGEAVLRKRIPTPRADYDQTVAAVVRLVEGIEKERGEKGLVGVGTPGAASPFTGLLRNCNSVWLNGRPLGGDLSRELGRPVRLANDANCFALSEARDGAGAGARVVFGVILGTGVGGGLVVEGRMWTGPNAIAGEWGHNPLPWPLPGEWPGPRCYCGKTGCIETFLSGPGLRDDHERATGERLSPETLVAKAAAGEGPAETTLARYEARLARALASVINVLDPDVIVLGGGLSNLSRLYESVPRRWSEFVFSDRVDTRLLPPLHGDSSGVRGAAWLWDETL
jgi:fructokinase